jgi:hypothetical protein
MPPGLIRNLTPGLNVIEGVIAVVDGAAEGCAHAALSGYTIARRPAAESCKNGRYGAQAPGDFDAASTSGNREWSSNGKLSFRRLFNPTMQVVPFRHDLAFPLSRPLTISESQASTCSNEIGFEFVRPSASAVSAVSTDING